MKWLKYGCFGCLGAAVLVALVIGVVIGIARQRARDLTPEEHRLTRQLPAAPATDEGPDAVALPLGKITADLGATRPPAPAQPAGRVILALSDGEFRIVPGEPGRAARVEATFDRRYYAMEERFDQGDDGRWTYKVTFGRTASRSFLTSLSELIAGSKPRADVYLPPDVPMDLEVDASRGGTIAELGGLWLRTADLSFSMGGAKMEVGEPMREPMERLSIRTSMGGGAFVSLGNASPRQLDVEHSMGGMSLDLRGRWTGDATVRISSSMGGGALTLPRGVKIEGLQGIDGVEESSAAAGAPTLAFSVENEMGEMRVIYRD